MGHPQSIWVCFMEFCILFADERERHKLFVTHAWIISSLEAAHEDMVLICAFVLNISVETGRQNNYSTIWDLLSERPALSETLQTGWSVNGEKSDVSNNTVEGSTWTRECHITPSKPEAVRPVNNLLSRNVFSSNFYHLEIIVHSKCPMFSPITSCWHKWKCFLWAKTPKHALAYWIFIERCYWKMKLRKK